MKAVILEKVVTLIWTREKHEERQSGCGDVRTASDSLLRSSKRGCSSVEMINISWDWRRNTDSVHVLKLVAKEFRRGTERTENGDSRNGLRIHGI
jgi:hypothetical protein